MNISVKLLPHAHGLILPAYATTGSAGMDLRAAVGEDVVCAVGKKQIIPTGICVALPDGYQAEVRPRSGLAFKYGITVLNTPGTIDSDYRGEVKVILINLGDEDYVVSRGDRIAQMVIMPYVKANLVLAEDLSSTVREDGGFGHTGK